MPDLTPITVTLTAEEKNYVVEHLAKIAERASVRAERVDSTRTRNANRYEVGLCDAIIAKCQTAAE